MAPPNEKIPIHTRDGSVFVEGCVTGPDEAAQCFAVGAHRVEICRDLHVGGLTPNLDLVEDVRSTGAGSVFVLVRSRPGSFRLSSAETRRLIEETRVAAEAGADGIVVGVLDRTGRVDGPALHDLVQAAGGLPVTFHRAFDEVADPLLELETLIRAGVTRVLTSGGAATAWEGRVNLRALVDVAADAITVLGGGRIRDTHVRQLIEETALTEVHARAEAIPAIMDQLLVGRGGGP